MISFLWAALPIVVVGVAIAAGLRAAGAAGLGVVAFAVGSVAAFPLPLRQTGRMLVHWLPIGLEIVVILAGGIVLAALLERCGAQARLATHVESVVGTQLAGVLLVVHGVTPFAEAIMGFGVGAMIGVPLLLHLRVPPAKAAVIGLLGLSTVPWGAMGPGTLVAAQLGGIGFGELGRASAAVSAPVFWFTGLAAVVLVNGWRVMPLVGALASGTVLWLSVWASNIVVGTAPAGALGALITIVIHLGLRRAGGVRIGWPPEVRRALIPYATVLGGVLLASAITVGQPKGSAWSYLASPALWLPVACCAVPLIYRGVRHAPAVRSGAQTWWKVAPATVAFLVLGICMLAAGMPQSLAATAGRAGDAYAFVAPFLGAIGGFLTGSNTGANAMFAATQAAAAQGMGIGVTGFLATHNAAASVLTAASPSRVEMAVRLCPAAEVSPGATTARVLAVDVVIVAALGLLNLLA